MDAGWWLILGALLGVGDRDRSKPITAAVEGAMLVGLAGLIVGSLLEEAFSFAEPDERYVFWTMVAIVVALEVAYWWEHRKDDRAAVRASASSVTTGPPPQPTAPPSPQVRRQRLVPMLNAKGEIVQVPYEVPPDSPARE